METSPLGWYGPLVALWLGLSVGSFGNVLIYRLPIEGLSVTRPVRSSDGTPPAVVHAAHAGGATVGEAADVGGVVAGVERVAWLAL